MKRAARWVLTSALALAPMASAASLAATPPAPTQGGVLWCCVNPNRLNKGPVGPQLPTQRRLPGTPAGRRLRRGRVSGTVAGGVSLRERLRARKRKLAEALVGPARFVRIAADGSAELALMIEGLHCGDCIQTVERALAAVPGVREARINYAGGTARVAWDGDRPVDPAALVAAVAAAGYGARAYDPGLAEAPLAERRRAWLMRLAVAGFGAIATMFLAEPLYYTYGALNDHDLALQQLLRFLGMVVGTATAAYAAQPFIRAALAGLGRLRLGMDALATIAILATWLASVWGFVTHGPVYFDSLTMFLFLLVGARFADGAVRARIMGAVERQLGAAPDTARLVRGGAIQEVAVSLLVPGDVLELRPGDRAPADGVIVRGRTSVDESLLTGEARALARGVGEAVPGGAIVVEGAIRVQLTRVGDDATQARLARLVAEAERPTGRAQRLADAAGHWGTLGVLAAAIATAIGWALVDPARALPAAVAVLVVTCPCALGLAIPAAQVAAQARALRAGMLIKRGEALEDLAAIDHVIFDKTGTLTTGEPEVVGLLGEEAAALAIAAALEAGSEHPLGRAVVRFARTRGYDAAAPADDFRASPGLGVMGTVDGQPALAGRADWLAEAGVALPPAWQNTADGWMARGLTVLWVARGGRAVGAIALGDTVRPEAADVVARLREAGVTVALLTGDNAGAAAHVAAQLGITDVTAGVLPDGKLAAIRAARAAHGRVAMVGDGLNDAPALAGADVGIALARGADLTTLAADVVLLGDRIGAVAEVIMLARRTGRVIGENLALSVLYNVVAIPLAVAGLVGPLLAAVLMPASSLVVLVNTFRKRS